MIPERLKGICGMRWRAHRLILFLYCRVAARKTDPGSAGCKIASTKASVSWALMINMARSSMVRSAAVSALCRTKSVMVRPSRSAARWINESRDIVGVYANTLDECYAFQAHGFLLRQGAYTAIDFPGSVYTEAFSINDDGVIVGDYTDKNGNTHGFKAVPKDEK